MSHRSALEVDTQGHKVGHQTDRLGECFSGEELGRGAVKELAGRGND